ncbi:transaldolase [Silvibacterium dinghuense]|uniref:Transaldolase n=1 Tax=Silvibacterium dinghuense TaxID=1560006 RepID=A0A4Q1SGM5_9BACT|nr:transaldolase [Silvibacterium dinghuense]RXS96691.1 transaldolase [Silvibacterium dinghuense]GGG92911.1 transaldolase [Silvibacterium dinghuense]
MPPSGQNHIRIFCDGADLDSVRAYAANPTVQGFTTNPTLMRKAGITDYEAFARTFLHLVPHLPVSFEVFADDEAEMEAQAYAIARWSPNVNVKIPVTDRSGRFLGELMQRLAVAGITVNVTAVLTLEQVERILEILPAQAPAIVSIFAGRIADTGVNPVPVMRRAAEWLHAHSSAQLLWASPREVLNFYQAEEAGCDIITMPPDLLAKLSLAGKNLDQYSLETVEMFFRDAQAAAYAIDTADLFPPQPLAMGVETPMHAIQRNGESEVLVLADGNRRSPLPRPAAP